MDDGSVSGQQVDNGWTKADQGIVMSLRAGRP